MLLTHGECSYEPIFPPMVTYLSYLSSPQGKDFLITTLILQGCVHSFKHEYILQESGNRILYSSQKVNHSGNMGMPLICVTQKQPHILTERSILIY